MAAMVKRPTLSCDQPASKTPSAKSAAATAATPEAVISHVKAKRKCHHPARQPMGASASSSRARSASKRLSNAPVSHQFIDQSFWSAIRPYTARPPARLAVCTWHAHRMGDEENRFSYRRLERLLNARIPRDK